MSDEAKPLNEEKADDKKLPKEEEPEEGGCSKCWNGYCACIVAICKVNFK